MLMQGNRKGQNNYTRKHNVKQYSTRERILDSAINTIDAADFHTNQVAKQKQQNMSFMSQLTQWNWSFWNQWMYKIWYNETTRLQDSQQIKHEPMLERKLKTCIGGLSIETQPAITPKIDWRFIIKVHNGSNSIQHDRALITLSLMRSN